MLAFLGQLNTGLSNTARTASRTSSGFMQSNTYLKALGTTMRYAFALEVVQRIRAAYQNLREFQNGLADVVAVGTDAGQTTQQVSAQMSNLGTSALRISNQTATSATDILNTMRSIYSSVPGVNQQRVVGLTSLATRGAAISETDPRTFIQAVLGMRNAFGHEAGSIEDISDQFFTVIQRSINMSGDEWAHYSGRVVAAAKIAGTSLAQMNALMVLMTRSGGTAATNVRHLAQLAQRIRFPTKAAIPFYEAAGVPVDATGAVTRPGYGGIEVMRTLLTHAARLNGVPTADFSAKAVSSMPPAALREQVRAATTGTGLGFLHGAVGGRMEGFRAFLVLAQHIGQYQKELDAADNSQGAINRQFERFLREKPLEAMSTSMNDFTVGLLKAGNPLFRAMAQGERKFTDWSLRAESWIGKSAEPRINRTASRLLSHIPGMGSSKSLATGKAGDAALAAVVLGGGTLGGLGRFGKAFNLLSRVGKASATGVLTAEALPAALQGVGQGSRAAPFWVIIHPLSWAMAPKGFGGGGGSPFDFLKKFTLARKLPGIAARVGVGASRLAVRGSFYGARNAAYGVAFAAEAPAIPDIIAQLRGKDPFGYRIREKQGRAQEQRATTLLNVAVKEANPALLHAALAQHGVSLVSHAAVGGEIVARLRISPNDALKGIVKPKVVILRIPLDTFARATAPELKAAPSP